MGGPVVPGVSMVLPPRQAVVSSLFGEYHVARACDA